MDLDSVVELYSLSSLSMVLLSINLCNNTMYTTNIPTRVVKYMYKPKILFCNDKVANLQESKQGGSVYIQYLQPRS